MKDVRHLEIWQQSHKPALAIYHVTAQKPRRVGASIYNLGLSTLGSTGH